MRNDDPEYVFLVVIASAVLQSTRMQRILGEEAYKEDHQFRYSYPGGPQSVGVDPSRRVPCLFLVIRSAYEPLQHLATGPKNLSDLGDGCSTH